MLYGTIPYSGVEFRCAVQSSALCDGIVALLVCSAGTVVAHFSIGLTEHRHRQSGAVRPSRDRLSRRQCMARPVCRRNVLRGTPGLHQCIRPPAPWTRCEDGDSRAAPNKIHGLGRQLAADGFAEPRSTVGLSLCTSSRRLHAAEQLPRRSRSTKLVTPCRRSRLRIGARLTSPPRQSGPACWRAQRQPHSAWCA